MKNSINKKMEIIIFSILIVIIILSLEVLINMVFASNEPYVNHTRVLNDVTINYPYFKSARMNDTIRKYYQDKTGIDSINYDIYQTDKYTCILFKEAKDNKIVNYDSFLYDINGNEVDINYFIKDEEILKDRIAIYLEQNNLNISDFLSIKYVYYFMKDELIVFLVDTDNARSIEAEIDYNEIGDILKINYNANDEYVKMLTTTITTTTTTTTTTVAAKSTSNTSDSGNKIISFTFDDGPSKYTTLILDVLDQYGAKATFFEVGYMIKNRGEIVGDVLARGHEIGNHTTDHSNLNKLSEAKIKEKVYDNNNTFRDMTGLNFPLLRPPYGNCKKEIRHLIDVPIIKWSVDSRDWESRNRDKIVALVKKQTKSGDIVLFHDLYESTYEAIKVLVPYYYENGYKIVTVSELFKVNGIELEPSVVYNSARG